MITSDMFTQFGRRMASTQGFPYIAMAETPNPIRQLEADTARVRAEAMLPAVIDGLTMPPAEIERRLKDIAKQQAPQDAVRAAAPL